MMNVTTRYNPSLLIVVLLMLLMLQLLDSSLGFVQQSCSTRTTTFTTTQLAFDLWNQQQRKKNAKEIEINKNIDNDDDGNHNKLITSKKTIPFEERTVSHDTPERNNSLTKDDELLQQVDRYKNRAALTEAILKEKIQEMNLLQGKMIILQDVVGRLQMESKRKLEQQEMAHQEKLVSIQSEWNQTKNMLNEQKQAHLKVVKDLQRNMVQQKVDTKDALQQAIVERQGMERRIKALQMEVLDMDSVLETTQSELQKVQRELVITEEHVQSRDLTKDRQLGRLEAKVKELELALDMAHTNATKMNQLRMESVEIAEAAVRAAEAREAKVQSDLQEFQQLVSYLRKENELLKSSMMLPTNSDTSGQARIQQLETKLEQERLLNDANRKLDKERFEVRLSMERTKHEQELKQLQAQLLEQTITHRKSSVDGSRLKQFWRRLQSIIN